VNDYNDPTVIRRILVAVDASPHSQAALSAAVEIAAQFQAELLGLFVEDINLLRLGDLPFVYELGIYSGHRRRVDTEEMKQRLRARAQQLRRIFRSLARQASVRSTFHVARGTVTHEIEAAAQNADLLILGRAGWSYIRTRQLGSTARAACCIEAPRIIVFMREGTKVQLPFHVAYNGSPVADRALAMAVAWMQRCAWTGPLLILLLTDDEAHIADLKTQADERLHGYPITRHYRALTHTNLPMMAGALQETGGGTLILPAEPTFLQENEIVALVEMIDLPVVLVR
jgi:nucleotide-binding universal stress UspA family protein